MQAKSVIIEEQGAPDVLQLREADVGSPAAGEVLIEQTAVGLNFIDVYHRGGQYELPLPSGIGSEAAGIVLEVGDGVEDVKAGDRVVYAGGPPGAYATHRAFPAARVVPIPDGIDDDVAAAVLLKGMTVEYLLNRCFPLKAGQFALFHAAAGGVGQLAGQWGKHIGAEMIGVAGGAEKCQAALDNGYAHAIDRNSEDVLARVKEITGGAGVPVVYDSVGAATYEVSMDSLAPRGMFVSFGTTTGEPPATPASRLQKSGSLYFTRPTLVTYTASRQELLDSAGAVFGLLQSGDLKVSINQRYALDDVIQAHADLEAGKTKGSTILTP